MNGEELLETRDDGAFLDILKNFFQYIGQLEDNGRLTKLTVRLFLKEKLIKINHIVYRNSTKSC